MKTRIKEARKSAGLTQAQLAEQTHLSRNFIALLESGRENPSDRTLDDIARICSVNTIWLMTGEGEMKAPQTREEEISDIAAQLFKEGEDSFRYQLIKLISQMDETKIRTLKEIAIEISESAKKSKE